METQDPISTQNQAQNPDNVNINTNSENSTEKLSAAELLLQKLQQHKTNSESLEQIIQEIGDNSTAEQTNSQVETSDVPIDEQNSSEESADDPSVHYAEFSLEQLVAELKNIIDNNEDILAQKDRVEYIKTLFYKKIKAENQELKAKFVENGNNEEDFKPVANPLENDFRAAYNTYREKRNKYNEQLENQKLENLQKKREIIDKIENLVNSQETLNQTFDEFKNLQKQWREIGIVPQTETKKLWDSYNYQVERFYDFVKINKELRDLDLKKNTEQKIKLCEKAEELLLEEKVITAFNELQKLHEQWRDTGPALTANKEELWERFKKATSTIHKKYQDYYANLKKEQEANYKAKVLLCEKTEEIASGVYTSRAEWDEKSKEIIELQRVWKLIGFAPKKHNNAVYERFRSACDSFFEKKREFYNQNREESDNNLQRKEDLCIQAEGLKDSTDWRKTTDILKNLQAKWKTIGPVPKKNSEEIWQRFRSACNTFFDNKKKFFEEQDKEQDENLKRKQDLITEIENFEHSDNEEKNISALKEFQKRWLQIGLVPIEKKEEIYNKFRSVIDAQFAKFNIDEAKRLELKVKNLIESLKNSPQAFERLRAERDKIKTRIDTLTQQLSLSENNLGFFGNSKNAESMIESLKKKMEKSRTEIVNLKKLSDLLNKAIDELPKRGNKKNK